MSAPEWLPAGMDLTVETERWHGLTSDGVYSQRLTASMQGISRTETELGELNYTQQLHILQALAEQVIAIIAAQCRNRHPFGQTWCTREFGHDDPICWSMDEETGTRTGWGTR